MLEYIKGKLIEASPIKAIVDINGLGYKLLISLNTYAKIPPLGKEVCLFISTVIREDSHKLFGFLTRAERDLFEKLTDVSGVGPKTALALIGHMEIGDLQRAITSDNIPLLCKIPGVGKKTAERLVIDLRDKVKNLDESGPQAKPQGSVADAINALINLGYTTQRAQKAIQTVLDKSPVEPPLSELITLALRNM
jgi:holliday junction DNA helicase RuvA